ncbi:MAG: Ig-like domain-containing protein [Coriobacteriales bacterium]|nr:Ig-like domain-containing protein [Coriobacteriales bacterium]
MGFTEKNINRFEKVLRGATSLCLALVLLTATSMIGCNTQNLPDNIVETPERSHTMSITGSKTLDIGESVSLSIVADFTYDSSEVSWTSSNPAVATVDRGTVMAVASGSVTITAEIVEPAVSASIEVSVVDPEEQARQAEAEAAERERQATLDAAVSPSNSLSATLTDNNGYKIQADIKLSNWIKGSESGQLQSAWKKVGGSGSIPITSGSEFEEGESGGLHALNDANSAAYVFGTIAFSNLTTDYPAKNFGGGYVSFNLHIENTSQPQLNMFSAVQYGSSIKTNWTYGGMSLKIVIFTPDMQNNNWGPAPFVIVLENVFTPEYPNGNPTLDAASFRGPNLRGESISIGKTW